jgi:hypothetical protein
MNDKRAAPTANLLQFPLDGRNFKLRKTAQTQATSALRVGRAPLATVAGKRRLDPAG